jgi:hypothetical protein
VDATDLTKIRCLPGEAGREKAENCPANCFGQQQQQQKTTLYESGQNAERSKCGQWLQGMFVLGRFTSLIDQ